MSTPTRADELNTLKEKYDKEVQKVSGCCGARVDNSSRCSACKDGAVAEHAISFDEWLLEIS